MKPSLGRTVHYVLQSGDHRAAIITQVPGTLLQVTDKGTTASGIAVPDVVDLTIFCVSGDFDGRRMDVSMPVGLCGIAFSDEPKPGTWHWPEREE